jgi:hypothetical protein
VRTPELSRLVETFIRVGSQTDLSLDRYFHLLRTQVAPLVRTLRERELVGWFSFFVHDRSSGVPTARDDHAAYLHLRLELLPGVTLDAIKDMLPPVCVLTQMAVPVDERSLFPADYTALVALRLQPAGLCLGLLPSGPSTSHAHTEMIGRWLSRTLDSFSTTSAINFWWEARIFQCHQSNRNKI